MFLIDFYVKDDPLLESLVLLKQPRKSAEVTGYLALCVTHGPYFVIP